MDDAAVTLFDMIAAGLAVLAAGELVAAQFFAGQNKPQQKLIVSLLVWEGIAMFACAGVIYVRQTFDMATIVSLIAIWMAGAGVGLLRAGVFDGPRE
ncbi:MAG: hypothetical protein JNK07_13535 [Alphaproteobacteria bacterium]|nr:hypothetical protein [Alphaproteobacteria bacterium]